MAKHNYYDEISPSYDELHGVEQINKINIILENLFIKNSDKVLDIGGGTGLLSEILNAKIINLEPSLKMIERGILKKRLFVPINDCAENISALFKKDEFDYVFCLTSAHHFNDVEKVFLGIKKTAKKDAGVFFSFLKRAVSTPLLIEKSKNFFLLEKLVEDDKDLILFMKNK